MVAAGAGEGGQQIPGMVVEEVDPPGFGAVTERNLGGVDLPQVVGDLPFESLVGSRTSWRLCGHQPVTTQRLMHRRHCRCFKTLSGQLGADAAGTPTGMVSAHLNDPFLQLDGDLGWRGLRFSGLVLQTIQAFGQIAASIPVVGVPGDPITTAHIGHRLPGP